MLTACPVSFKICSFVFLPPDACNFQTQKIAFWKILKPRQYDNKNGKYKHIAETHFDSLVLPLQLISQVDREYSIFLTPNYNTFLSLKIWIFFNKILKAHQLNMNKRKKKKKVTNLITWVRMGRFGSAFWDSKCFASFIFFFYAHYFESPQNFKLKNTYYVSKWV